MTKRLIISLMFSVSCICFSNNLRCQELTDMIQGIDKTKLDFIDFNISPISKRVQLILIKDRPTVDSLLKHFNGQLIPVNKNYRYDASLYLLSNNLLLVDRYEASKANPYYLCNSFEDFLFIDKNFFIYRHSKDAPAIVQYRISQEHLKIKDFLSKPNVSFIKHDEQTNQDVYKTNDNKFIVTQSVRNTINDKDNPFSVISNLFVKPEYVKDSTIYIELSMFESFDMMQLSGILDSDEEIDETNFKAYSTLIFQSNEKGQVACTVYNAKEGGELSPKESSEYSLFKLPGASKSNKKLKSGEILLAYPDSIYLLFKNEFELKQVFDHLKQSVSIDFSNEEIQKLINGTKILLSSNIEDKVKFLPKSIRQDKPLEEILQIYDAEMNRYFWDNLFIKENFLEMLGFAGIVLTEKVGGEWKYINSLNRPVFQLRTGEQLDIISYFVEEALTQKYTGYCSLEGIVSTLLLSSKLKVGRIDTLLN